MRIVDFGLRNVGPAAVNGLSRFRLHGSWSAPFLLSLLPLLSLLVASRCDRSSYWLTAILTATWICCQCRQPVAHPFSFHLARSHSPLLPSPESLISSL